MLTLCEWFAMCKRPATGTTPHVVLGQVPSCDRCHAFATNNAELFVWVEPKKEKTS
jgi:hypothetical protein